MGVHVPRQAEDNFALVSFRNPNDTLQLLKTAKDEIVRPRAILKRHGAILPTDSNETLGRESGNKVNQAMQALVSEVQRNPSDEQRQVCLRAAVRQTRFDMKISCN
jgi:flagellar biosynthesis/type III secretory pathway chaperone